MLQMILKMTAVTALYVLLTVLLWRGVRDKTLSRSAVIGIGILYGGCSILSTHFGVSYNGLFMLNVRDIGPLAAGLFFHPVSGIIAGLIGGIERYIAGAYWGIGAYTRIACGVSTCLAGIVAALMRVFIFKRKKPFANYAFFMGAVMEIFHMYVILITHREDISMAFSVVRACAGPMILFTAIGMECASIAIRLIDGDWKNPLHRRKKAEIPVSDRFRLWLFVAIAAIFAINFLIAFMIQGQESMQNARTILGNKSESIRKSYQQLSDSGIDLKTIYYIGESQGTFDIIKSNGIILEGNHKNFTLPDRIFETIRSKPDDSFFRATVFNRDSLCRVDDIEDGLILLTMMSMDDIYENRNIHFLETAFEDILVISFVYILISFLVQKIVVDDLDQVNASLEKITDGDLNEVVDARSSAEFASLSDDINQTVDVLKGFIAAAENRNAEELQLARTIQESALPKDFDLQRNDVEIRASMVPAKTVGGDFYDFFMIGKNSLALVIADVSGKGIPAALFMMRSKALIRSQAESHKSPAEIFRNVNESLCEGNDADMFVTVWIGILNLDTGLMQCANAGHEYPVLMRVNEDFEVLKDQHSLCLGAMPGIRFREYELQLHRGDRLFVYTDGIPEAINENEELYGIERMTRALNSAKDQSVAEMLQAVSRDQDHFVGTASQFDDITMLGLQYNGPDRKSLSLHIPARVDNLPQVLEFIDKNLEAAGCAPKTQTQIDVAVEELFVNVANYAYQPGVGDSKFTVEILENPKTVKIVMKDTGLPFNPLERTDPDITLSAEEREIGGLGIFMAKKYMDELQYRRENGKNVLTLWKKIE